ncbi:MAG: aminoglycoside phosphotransferase family protein [Bacteroidales bacterium]|nr:aminoglycoside phosphotransferase family protein [Bacteroidales bacterium]
MPQSNFNFDIHSIIRQFAITGHPISLIPTGEGHINDTFLVETEADDEEDYILQRVNHKIFTDVPGLMKNILRVTEHINLKYNCDPGKYALQAPRLIPTIAHQNYHRDESGNYWRCYNYLPHYAPKELTANQALEGGRAIGKFQAILADLPGGALHITIPDFHNVKMRLENLKKVLAQNPADRASMVEKELNMILMREEEMYRIFLLEKAGKIPVRITHNDTKFNNLLFNENGQAISIIDLDTVMNGSVLYDFGDAVRTLCNTAAEDEADLTKVDFDILLFHHFAHGYLRETHTMLNVTELKHLAFSCKLLTYIMAVRFMTDYLAGDVYFKIRHSQHNLDRARNQLKLLDCMERDFAKMETTIRKYSTD